MSLINHWAERKAAPSRSPLSRRKELCGARRLRPPLWWESEAGRADAVAPLHKGAILLWPFFFGLNLRDPRLITAHSLQTNFEEQPTTAGGVFWSYPCEALPVFQNFFLLLVTLEALVLL